MPKQRELEFEESPQIFEIKASVVYRRMEAGTLIEDFSITRAFDMNVLLMALLRYKAMMTSKKEVAQVLMELSTTFNKRVLEDFIDGKNKEAEEEEPSK